MKKKNLPLGYDDFWKLREADRYFVDKTLMIGEFLDSSDEVALITRSRRFGKTLNMTMLRKNYWNTTVIRWILFMRLRAIMRPVTAGRISA